MARTHYAVDNWTRKYEITTLAGEPVAYVLANTLLQVDAPWLIAGSYIVFPEQGTPVRLYLTDERARLGQAPANAEAVRAAWDAGTRAAAVESMAAFYGSSPWN